MSTTTEWRLCLVGSNMRTIGIASLWFVSAGAASPEEGPPTPTGLRVGLCVGADVSCMLANLKVEYATESVGVSLSGLGGPSGGAAAVSVKKYISRKIQPQWSSRRFVYAGSGAYTMNDVSRQEIVFGGGAGMDMHLRSLMPENLLLQVSLGLGYSLSNSDEAPPPVTPLLGAAAMWNF